MASVISFEPDPPRVTSPWSTPRTSTPRLGPRHSSSPGPVAVLPEGLGHDIGDGLVVTSLDAEPQDGPTEYKLHLLLRQRRKFTYSSTSSQIPTSIKSPVVIPRAASESKLQNSPLLVTSTLSRGQRLEHLTTQLLWRLQQSCSYQEQGVSSFKANLKGIFDSSDCSNANALISRLGDSKGALYEIGVADDGGFVGLAEDELNESLETLKLMAATLGCGVTLVRKVIVGECRWLETSTAHNDTSESHGPLWVAEAYVRPNMGFQIRRRMSIAEREAPDAADANESLAEKYTAPVTEQLRITLSGATASGKSSLLGTLITNILDDGKGKSRLHLLRHPHEQASGRTSSVTQELLGYNSTRDGSGNIQVINYLPQEDILSWIDIHAKSQGGRLVVISDSAGHPRYRRTTVRGLLGWNPHWTLLCLPADAHEDTTGRPGSTPPAHETLGIAATDLSLDLSEEHLNLCLQLDLPLIVVITKQDLATRQGLRNYLNKLLSTLKRFERQPLLIAEANKPIFESEAPTITPKDLEDLSARLPSLEANAHRLVPIILTSALTGAGIRTLHALLFRLPLFNLGESDPDKSLYHELNDPLFDVEDVYRGKSQTVAEGQMVILNGLVRRGQISIGDELLVGPFPGDQLGGNSPSREIRQLMPGFTSLSGVSPPPPKSSVTRGSPDTEWCNAVVYSVRHLRQPARTLFSGQVGSLGVMPLLPQHVGHLETVRKGMVVTSGSPQARRTFTGRFHQVDLDNLYIGSTVVVYFNSVRASAKIIVGSTTGAGPDSIVEASSEDEGFAFQFDGDERKRIGNTDAGKSKEILVTFEFIGAKEYVEVGVKVLVMPGGGFGVYKGSNRSQRGVAGFSGFAGIVVDAVDIREQQR